MSTERAGLVVGSPEWLRVVTASKVAGILGLSPWASPRSVWHQMRGELPNDDGRNANAKSRGHYLESGVIAWWLDQHDVMNGREQAHLTLSDWGAATPDLIGIDEYGNDFVMDAKTAASDDDWGDEPPPYYLAQSMWQLACHPEAQVAYIAVLFGRPQLAFREYVIQRDNDLIASIVDRCRSFYDSLTDDSAAPDLDDTLATYEAIRSLHPDIDRDLTVDLDHDLARRYVTNSLALKAAEAADRATKTELLDVMGRARLALHDGATIARRQPLRDAVSLVRVAKQPPTIPAEGIPA